MEMGRWSIDGIHRCGSGQPGMLLLRLRRAVTTAW
jgi:hypothetical protein